ncbi:MAG: branched-chain amino acid ABC transporter permease [Solirubrobacteraceae bacterium]
MSVPQARVETEPPRVSDGAAGIAASALPQATVNRRELSLHGAALALLAAAPFMLGPGYLSTLGRILFFALLAASLALLVGFVGLPSLGHAAYFGIGAYAAGLIGIHVTASAPVQLAVAVLVAAAVAVPTGWLAIRSHGIYFLMLTLAIGEIVFLFAERSENVTGGSNGLFGIPASEVLPGAPVTDPAPLYWYVLAVFAVGYAVLWAATRSPFGLALRGIRDNEDRMRALGYATRRYKLAAFCLAGAVAGLAGALLAAHSRFVTPTDASFGTSVVALVAVIIGGAGSLWGACLGAAIVIIVRDEIGSSLGGHGPLVLGAVFILAVYLLPGGIAGLLGRLGRRRS